MEAMCRRLQRWMYEVSVCLTPSSYSEDLPHGKEEGEIDHIRPGRGIQLQMQVAHPMLDPIPDESWRILRYEHIQRA
jgi:hypothetical protein